MSLVTLHDRIVVRPMVAAKQVGAIEIVGKAVEEPNQGEVVAVGAGRMLGGKVVPLQVVPGDKIVFSCANPIDVEVDGEKLIVMSEGQVLAVLEDDDV